jgi:WD40 repeat protein
MAQLSSELEHAIGFACTAQPSLHVLPCGRRVAYVQGAQVVLRAFEDPHAQVFLRGHRAALSCLAMSDGGRFLASGDRGRESDVVVWDLATASELWRFSDYDGGVRVLTFSSDERLLLAIGCDNKLSVFDLKTGQLVAFTELPRAIGAVSAAEWGGYAKDIKRRDTDKYQFATVGEQVTMWLLDPYSGALTVEAADSKRNVRQCTCATFLYLPDAAGREGLVDEFLVAGTLSGDFVSYLVKPNKTSTGGAPVASFVSAVKAFHGGVFALASNRVDQSLLAVGAGDGSLGLFSYTERDGWIDVDGTRLAGAVHNVAFSADGRELVAGSAGGQLVRGRCGALAKGTMLVAANPCGALTGVSFAPDSSTTFATSSTDGKVRVWSTSDYSVSMETGAANGVFPSCLQFSIDAIVSGWSDGRVRSHHSATGELLWEIRDAHQGGVTALRISNNMRFVVTGGEEGEVRVWELRARQMVSHLKEHAARVTRVALFSDDLHAVSVSKDRSMLCWDLRHDKRISAHTQRMGGINDVALNHDQTLVITCGQELTISFWDLREPYPVAQLQSPQQGMHADEGRCIAVAHSGALWATGGADGIVKLWTVQVDRPLLLQDNVGHTAPVTGLSFTADDRQLVSVGEDGCIFVWNVFALDGSEEKQPHK